MIDGLNIKKFRGFKNYTISNLNQVNLLVGGNNSGKTSVLEAVEILAGGGHPTPLLRCAMRRGEYNVEDDSRRRRVAVDFRHFFHNRVLEPESSFRITGSNDENQKVEIQLTKSAEQQTLFESSKKGINYEAFAQILNLRGPNAPKDSIDIRELQKRFANRRHHGQVGFSDIESTQFVSIEGDNLDSLAQLWDDMVLTTREEYVVNALNIIDPEIERVAFLGESRRRDPAYAGIVVKKKGTEKRFPIGSMGDGVKRLLNLSIHLASIPDGFLLVDEIDTGLHYSVMEKMWRLVIQAAADLNIQVFATTHSLDCLQSIAHLHEEDSAMANKLTVHRIEPGMEKSITHSSSELRKAIKHEMEVR
jgi:AAA15 family ATPase/GTPase